MRVTKNEPKIGPRGAVWGWSRLGSELDAAGVESVENREKWRLAGIGRHWPRGGWVGGGRGVGGGWDMGRGKVVPLINLPSGTDDGR